MLTIMYTGYIWFSRLRGTYIFKDLSLKFIVITFKLALEKSLLLPNINCKNRYNHFRLPFHMRLYDFSKLNKLKHSFINIMNLAYTWKKTPL